MIRSSLLSRKSGSSRRSIRLVVSSGAGIPECIVLISLGWVAGFGYIKLVELEHTPEGIFLSRRVGLLSGLNRVGTY